MFDSGEEYELVKSFVVIIWILAKSSEMPTFNYKLEELASSYL